MASNYNMVARPPVVAAPERKASKPTGAASSATTVMTVGFVSAGLLNFQAALGIILGANVGSTGLGWLVALLGFKLKLGTVVLPLILVGALMRLARVGAIEAVRVLLDAGAQLDHTAKYRLSALMLAVLNRHHEIVRMLIAAGADLTLKGSGAPGFAGKTALDLATQSGDDEMVRLLEGHISG